MKARIGPAPVAVGLILLLPLLLPNALLTIYIFIGLSTMVVSGLSLLMGFAGQVSLGQAGFYAIGAYTAALLARDLSVPPVLGLIVAPAATAGIAYIVGLPLQCSLFNQAARAATTIGLPGLSSERDFPARLDESGDLFLDRLKVAALTQALLSWLTPETLELMYTTHAAACDALVEASGNAARVATSVDGEARILSEDLANRMALVLAYGILSKFVPDVLLRALADAGDAEPARFVLHLRRRRRTVAAGGEHLGHGQRRLARLGEERGPHEPQAP
jgi:hypothetical protein